MMEREKDAQMAKDSMQMAGIMIQLETMGHGFAQWVAAKIKRESFGENAKY